MKDKGECVFGACGKFHTVVVMANGDAYAWGFNGMGQTGTGEVRPVSYTHLTLPTICSV